MIKSIFTVTAAGGIVAFLAMGPDAPTSGATFVTAPVEYGRLQEDVTATGTVDALFTVDISSQVSGRITAVNAGFNDAVSKGQALAQIDRQGFEAQVAEAEAAVNIAQAAVEVQEATRRRAAAEIEVVKLEGEVYRARIDQAQAEYALARSNLDRKEGLRRSGTISTVDIESERAAMLSAAARLREAEALMATNEQRVEAVRADLSRAEAELVGARSSVPQRRAALQLARVELERTTIRTPIDGVIINRSIEEGQTVAATLEAPTLFTVARALSQMVVYVSVDETDIGRIRLGQPALFTVDAFPDRQFTGKMSEIRKSAKTIQNIVTYTVVLRTDNHEELLFPGMTALVNITVSQSDPGLTVPTAALSFAPSEKEAQVQSEGSATIWRLNPSGDLQPLRIEPGQSNASHTTVSGPDLAEGDRIVISEISEGGPSGLFGAWYGD